MCRRNPSSASVAFRMSWVTHGPSGSALVPAEDPEQAVERILTLVRERIPRRFGLDPVRDIQVLCPMNRGGAGARSLNVELQAALNPAGEEKVERFGWTFSPGDKVMQIENDYDKDVYNGDITPLLRGLSRRLRRRGRRFCQLSGSELGSRSGRTWATGSRSTRHGVPLGERSGAEHAVMGSPQQMASDPEEILHNAVDRGEPLEMPDRLEAAHLAFTLSGAFV